MKSSILGSLAQIVFALPLLMVSLHARAMVFEPLTLDSGAIVLLARDCGKGNTQVDAARIRRSDGKPGCEEWQAQIAGPADDGSYAGDAVTMDRLITAQEQSGKPFREIILYSGGGDLDEGVKLARVLRSHRASVRILKDTRCVSSCTVAFMGGMFRSMDEGGSYRVHSGSAYLQIKPERMQALLDLMHEDPAGTLIHIALRDQKEERFIARQLQALFQNTLLLPLNGIQVSENDAEFERWSQSNLPDFAYAHPGNPQLMADVERFKKEGPACLQDILMRIERDAMTEAIEDVRVMLPSLGRRATPALAMVQAMYMTSIKEVSDLNRETMIKMGYLTQEFQEAR